MEDFEKGRQDVLSDLTKTITFRLNHVVSLRGVVKGMAYSQEKRDGIEQTYKEILETISYLRDKENDKNRFAHEQL